MRVAIRIFEVRQTITKGKFKFLGVEYPCIAET